MKGTISSRPFGEAIFLGSGNPSGMNNVVVIKLTCAAAHIFFERRDVALSEVASTLSAWLTP